MNIAYRFRIYPNREQEVLLAKTFGCCRFLYNQMLNDKIRAVSYTHLVAKTTGNERKNKEARKQREADLQAVFDENQIVAAAKVNTREVELDNDRDAEAVYYTHLDVYKRQVWMFW